MLLWLERDDHIRIGQSRPIWLVWGTLNSNSWHYSRLYTDGCILLTLNPHLLRPYSLDGIYLAIVLFTLVFMYYYLFFFIYYIYIIFILYLFIILYIFFIIYNIIIIFLYILYLYYIYLYLFFILFIYYYLFFFILMPTRKSSIVRNRITHASRSHCHCTPPKESIGLLFFLRLLTADR